MPNGSLIRPPLRETSRRIMFSRIPFEPLCTRRVPRLYTRHVNVNLRRIAIQNSGIVCMTMLHTCRFITQHSLSLSAFLYLSLSLALFLSPITFICCRTSLLHRNSFHATFVSKKLRPVMQKKLTVYTLNGSYTRAEREKPHNVIIMNIIKW